MSTIVTRAGKGSALTHNEVDANFVNLNTDKIQSGNTVGSLIILSATISGGSITGITDLAVADGGTGASNQNDARTNLGLGTIATQNANNVAITGGSISGITDLAIADGGTGASSATTAFDNLAPTTTKGDLIAFNGTDNVRIAVGSDGQVLTANSATATGLAWQAAGGGFTSGTLMLFQQTAAPTGWTKQTTHDNKALRVVSGSASSGGSVAFTTAFANGSTGATTLTTAQIPSHSHSLSANNADNTGQTPRPGAVRNNASNFTPSTNTEGGGGSHTHSLTLAVQYVDLIIASKD